MWSKETDKRRLHMTTLFRRCFRGRKRKSESLHWADKLFIQGWWWPVSICEHFSPSNLSVLTPFRQSSIRWSSMRVAEGTSQYGNPRQLLVVLKTGTGDDCHSMCPQWIECSFGQLALFLSSKIRSIWCPPKVALSGQSRATYFFTSSLLWNKCVMMIATSATSFE